MFSLCSCEWEDEDDEDQKQDCSITFLVSTLKCVPVPAPHPFYRNHLWDEKGMKKKKPSSYLEGLITVEQATCLSLSLVGIIFSHHYVPARSLCSSVEALGLVMELRSTDPGTMEINWSVCLFDK